MTDEPRSVQVYTGLELLHETDPAKFYDLHVGRGVDVSCRGHWRRVGRTDTGDTGWKFRYYWRRVRVPWLAWAMFS